MNKEIFRLDGRRIPEGQDPSIGMRKYEDNIFLVGVVKSVDPDRWTMTVHLFDRKGIANDVPITQPYAGVSSSIASMPEKGTIVILANQRNFLWPIAYIPNTSAGLDSKILEGWPESVSTQEKNIFFYRLKSLNPGEISISSSDGAEIFLGDKLRLSNFLVNFEIDRDSRSISSYSDNNYLNAKGIFRNAGIIRRDQLVKENAQEGLFAHREILADGRVSYALKDSKSFPSGYFCEYLIEVEDRKNLTGTETKSTTAVFSMGNFVGNNPDEDNYAKILGVNLFKDENDEDGGINIKSLTGDDPSRYGIALCWFKPDRRNPNRGAFFGIDKEGHFYQYIPAATAGGLGRGRSMSIVGQGNKKEIWGADERYGTAWDLNLKGGIRWIIGKHNERDDNPYSNRSIDIKTSSSVYYQIGYTDDENTYDFDNPDQVLENSRQYKKIEKVEGYERKEVGSTRETIVEGNDRFRIEGQKEEQVIGAYSISAGSDVNIGVASSFSEQVTKEKQETFGSRKTTITQGSSELKIRSPRGDISEEILAVGNKTTDITAGNIEETIISGDRKFRTTVGNYQVNLASGNINMKTSIGNLSFKSSTGKVELQGFQNIDIKTSPASNINVQGGKINLRGKTFALGGVITGAPGVPSHFDYITGAPLVGSRSVGASF